MARRPKPATAEWIQRGRKSLRGPDGKSLSVAQFRDRLALAGVNVTEGTIQVWESYAGRKPHPDTLDVLERMFGSPAPERGEAQPTGDISALVAALNRQADAINALVTRLESLAGDAIRDGVEDALREAGLSPAVGESQAGRLPGQFV